MAMAESEGKMKGWLYLIRSSRFGLLCSRKRYFILEDNYLNSFKYIPTSQTEEPVRSAIIDSCIRVVDNGREIHNREIFFIFSLYNTSNHKDQLKLGAASPEDAARWIRSLQDAAVNAFKYLIPYSERKWQPFSLSLSKRMARKISINSSLASSMRVSAMTSDVIAPSPWKIFGCENGLRLFKEAKETDSRGTKWDNHPAIMAVGVIDASSEAVFHTLMSLGSSRTEWDFCFYRGSVVEHLDGHTDIVHTELYNHWLPWSMKRRDLLVRRYWRREDDGTYVILSHSVVHKKCPPKDGYVRAWLKSGGYVISPTKNGTKCVVKNMLAVDWRFWMSCIQKSASRSITIRMLGRISALREFFRAKGGNTSHEFLSGDLTVVDVSDSKKEEIRTETGVEWIQNKTEGEGSGRISVSGASSLMGLDDAADEFFDVPEPSDYEPLDNDWDAPTHPESYTDICQPIMSSAASFVKKLQVLSVQKKGYVDLQEKARDDKVLCRYGYTLARDSAFNMPCSWAAADPSLFLIRANNYLLDNQKSKAKNTLMQMVAADWLRSEKREDNLAGRYGSMVQKYAAQGGQDFFFVVNMQVPGTTTYNLALYYMLKTPLEQTPLLERFVNGDDAFRNSRFKLIPYISQGSWIVKQSVGKKACLVGQALEINYFRGKNYLELDINVGSSTVARGVVNLVLGYLNNLVIEMAFLIQGNTEEELPEFLLGTCRLNHLDASKSVSTGSIP